MIKFFIIFIEVYGKTCRLNMSTFFCCCFLKQNKTKANVSQKELIGKLILLDTD